DARRRLRHRPQPGDRGGHARNTAAPSPVTPSAMWFTEHPPIDISREAAADAARRELSRYIYANEEPNLLWRAISWLRDRLADLAITLGDAVPIGRWALLILPLLVVIALAVIRWRVGPVAATRAVTGPVFGPAVR